MIGHGAKFVLPGGHLLVTLRDVAGVSILAPRPQTAAVRLELQAPDGSVLNAIAFDSLAELFADNAAHAEPDPIQIHLEDEGSAD